VRRDDQLACRYRKTFGESASLSDDQAVMMGVAKALAAFQETFETPPTPFDRFRNALARGEPSSYPDAVRRGLRIFIANCASCHSGPNFTDGDFHDNGFSRSAG
jgi:cytochrome c peroxidase